MISFWPTQYRRSCVLCLVLCLVLYRVLYLGLWIATELSGVAGEDLCRREGVSVLLQVKNMLPWINAPHDVRQWEDTCSGQIMPVMLKVDTLRAPSGHWKLMWY